MPPQRANLLKMMISTKTTASSYQPSFKNFKIDLDSQFTMNHEQEERNNAARRCPRLSATSPSEATPWNEPRGGRIAASNHGVGRATSDHIVEAIILSPDALQMDRTGKKKIKKKNPGLISKLFSNKTRPKGKEDKPQHQSPPQDAPTISGSTAVTQESNGSSRKLSPSSAADELPSVANEVRGASRKDQRSGRNKIRSATAAQESEDDFLGSLLLFPSATADCRMTKQQSFSSLCSGSYQQKRRSAKISPTATASDRGPELGSRMKNKLPSVRSLAEETVYYDHKHNDTIATASESFHTNPTLGTMATIPLSVEPDQNRRLSSVGSHDAPPKLPPRCRSPDRRPAKNQYKHRNKSSYTPPPQLNNGDQYTGVGPTTRSLEPLCTEWTSAVDESEKITIAPGIQLPLRGAQETLQYLNRNEFATTVCMVCQETIHSIADADFVICPCKTIGALDKPRGDIRRSNSKRTGGVALGITTKELFAYKEERQEVIAD